MRIFLILSLFFAFESQSQFWQQQPDFPGNPRDDGAQFSIGDLHFCGTGRGSDFGCTRDFFYYDSYTGTWYAAAPLPLWQERQYATAFSYQEKGYIIGGENCNGNYFNTFWRYAPLTNTWDPMPEFPGSGRAGAQHFLIGSDLYWVGGRNDSGILNEVWCFQFDTQQWAQKADLPFNGIWRGIGFAHQTNGFIAGGRTNDANQSGWNSDTWLYDPQNDSWTNISVQLNLGTRMYLGSAQNDTLLFIWGGVDENDNVLSSLEKINLTTFQIEGLMPFSSNERKGCMYFVGNDYFHLTTGISANDRLNETWRIAFSPQAKLNENNLFDISQQLQDATILIKINPVLLGQQLKIRDIHGRILKTIQIVQTEQVISLLEFNAGTYFLEINGFSRKCLR